jgi:hypothetical protein
MIYVVLGMHKSGTTLVSQMLHASGINMVDTDSALGYDQGNKYERKIVTDINHALLQGCMVRPLSHGLYQLLYKNKWTRRAPSELYDSLSLARRLPSQASPAQRDRIGSAIAACQTAHPDWGFKDPRTCLTYPIWAQELPDHKLIVIYRSYGELLKRYRVYGRGQLRLTRLYRALHSWTFYNQQLIRYVNETNRPVIVLNYEALMRQAREFERLCAFTERALCDVRDEKQYRNRAPRRPALPVMGALMQYFLPAKPVEVYAALEQARLRGLN